MTHDPIREADLLCTRRQFFGRTALGVGTAALAGALGPDLFAGETPTPGMHHPAKAKRVIYLFMSGGPSHHDLWDYKPKMQEMFGKDLPEHIRDGQRITGMTARQKTLPVCPSKYEFTRPRQQRPTACGSANCCRTPPRSPRNSAWCTARFTEAINHDPAITYIQTGSQVPGRPSLGAWLSYGLGSMNENLPGYVVMHAQDRFRRAEPVQPAVGHRLSAVGPPGRAAAQPGRSGALPQQPRRA